MEVVGVVLGHLEEFGALGLCRHVSDLEGTACRGPRLSGSGRKQECVGNGGRQLLKPKRQEESRKHL